jgi:hypothetical protein
MKRFLCRIGLHRWRWVYRTERAGIWGAWWVGTGYKACGRCGKREPL